MKKYVSVLLAVLALSFYACGGDDDDDNGGPNGGGGGHQYGTAAAFPGGSFSGWLVMEKHGIAKDSVQYTVTISRENSQISCSMPQAQKGSYTFAAQTFDPIEDNTINVYGKLSNSAMQWGNTTTTVAGSFYDGAICLSGYCMDSQILFEFYNAKWKELEQNASVR